MPYILVTNKTSHKRKLAAEPCRKKSLRTHIQNVTNLPNVLADLAAKHFDDEIPAREWFLEIPLDAMNFDEKKLREKYRTLFPFPIFHLLFEYLAEPYLLNLHIHCAGHNAHFNVSKVYQEDLGTTLTLQWFPNTCARPCIGHGINCVIRLCKWNPPIDSSFEDSYLFNRVKSRSRKSSIIQVRNR
jgi:hypothetical protein